MPIISRLMLLMLTNKEILTLKKGKTLFCLFLILICFFVFFIHADVTKDVVFKFCTPYVNTEPENLVFYKYKVFGTEKSFQKNLYGYIEREKSFLKSKNEFIVVKINGKNSVDRKADYILIHEESIAELNAEIYIAKNFDFGNNSLPLKTLVVLLQKAVKTIFIIVYAIVFFIYFLNISRYFVVKKTNYGALSIKNLRNG